MNIKLGDIFYFNKDEWNPDVHVGMIEGIEVNQQSVTSYEKTEQDFNNVTVYLSDCVDNKKKVKGSMSCSINDLLGKQEKVL